MYGVPSCRPTYNSYRADSGSSSITAGPVDQSRLILDSKQRAKAMAHIHTCVSERFEFAKAKNERERLELIAREYSPAHPEIREMKQVSARQRSASF